MDPCLPDMDSAVTLSSAARGAVMPNGQEIVYNNTTTQRHDVRKVRAGQHLIAACICQPECQASCYVLYIMHTALR